MSERKNIERLFQEKFKDFEEIPSPMVWENIQSKLEKKEQKRRVIPFWLKSSGVAAIMVLGFFTADYYNEKTPSNSVGKSPETVVSSEASSPENNPNSKANKAISNDKISNQNNNVLENDGQHNENRLVYEKANNNTDLKENNTTVNKKNQHSTSNQSNSNLVSSEKMNSDKVSSSNKHPNSKRINHKKQFLPNPTNGLVAISPFKKIKEDKSSTSSVKEDQVSTSYNDNQKEFLAQNNISEKSNSKENPDQNLTQNNENDTNTINFNQNNAIANKANQNAISSDKISKDSVVVAAVAENPLNKILKEKETQEKEQKIIAEKTANWKVRPNVAPIFMNASQGSPLAEEFADNTKNFESNFSVGLGVDFALNSKFAIRTGINKFGLGYNTNDIEYYADLNAGRSSSNTLQTINMKADAKTIIVKDKKQSGTQTQELELAAQNTTEGYLNQRIGYVEVPFEVSYKLTDHKFGIQVITGLSTLFLNDNEVSVVSNGLTTVLGEANNLNKIHFSANVGVGFKYSFWKSFEANFEPTFKYQMNTFNSNSGGFKPYLIGLYSGVSFKF